MVASRVAFAAAAISARLDPTVSSLHNIFEQVKANPKRVVFAEGENPKIMQAVDAIVQEQLCFPIVLGRVEVINTIIRDYALTAQPGRDFEILEYEENEDWWREFHACTERRGKTLSEAREILRNSKTTQAAMMVKLGLADAMITGTIGRFHRHLGRILSVAKQDDGFDKVSALSIIISSN